MNWFKKLKKLFHVKRNTSRKIKPRLIKKKLTKVENKQAKIVDLKDPLDIDLGE